MDLGRPEGVPTGVLTLTSGQRAIGQSAKRSLPLVRTPVVRGRRAVIGQDIAGQEVAGFLLARTPVVIG